MTITGTNLANVTEVRFGSIPAEFTVSSAEVWATVPPRRDDWPDIPNDDGGHNRQPDPVLCSGASDQARAHPWAGRHGGDYSRVQFYERVVQFSGVTAAFTRVSSSELRAIVPAGAESGPISIATPAGFGSSDTRFYIPAIIAKVDPPSGAVLSNVTITGENLLGVTSVRFGGVEAAFTSVSGNALSATVPAGAVSGPITVTTPAGVVTSPEPFFVGLFSDLTSGVSAFPDSVGIVISSLTVTVTNRGPLDAQNVVVTDPSTGGCENHFRAFRGLNAWRPTMLSPALWAR